MSDAKRVTPPRPRASALLLVLTVPLVLIALATTVEYARYAYRTVALSSAVHDAVRTAAIRPCDWSPGPLDVARLAVHEGLARRGGATGLSLDARIDGQPGAQVLTVSAALPYHPLFGLVPVPQAVESTYGMPVAGAI